MRSQSRLWFLPCFAGWALLSFLIIAVIYLFSEVDGRKLTVAMGEKRLSRNQIVSIQHIANYG